MKGLTKIIEELEIVVDGLLWYIWPEYRKSGEHIELLEPYEEELEEAYQAGEKKRFNEIVKKALEGIGSENHKNG